MVSRSFGSPWDDANHYSPIRVCDCFDIHTKAQPLEQLFSRILRICKSGTAHNRARQLVGNTQHQVPTAFIGDGYAITAQFCRVVLLLGFLEFQILGF